MKRILPRNFKPNKTWIILGIALAIGLLAALAAHSYLSGQMAAIEARAKGNQVSVVVAKRDMKAGDTISSDKVAERLIPADYAQSGAVTPKQFDQLDGKVLAYPVKSGEMILWGLTADKRKPAFSARILPGRRAITVPVDEINSISGMLEPGDIVDLMLTVDQKGRKITFPLLQSASVMATGQRSGDDPKSGERRQYSTVTLDTTPEQAQTVIVAREAGKLTALLRNPADTQASGEGSADLAALLGLKGDARAPAPEGRRQVPVLYGGRGGSIPPEGLNLRSTVRSADAAPSAAPAGMQTTPHQAYPGGAATSAPAAPAMTHPDAAPP